MAHELPTVEVMGHDDNAIGNSDAASQGVVGAELLKNRPILRPAEVLEFIPGMVVTQHSGGGKANQYFLRGMNLDHGTDFAITLNGVPLNMPTHAHGQGYSDLNMLIPELVMHIDHRKGPYFASEGDFSSAGSANIAYRSRLEHPFSSVTVGERGYLRAVYGESREFGQGLTLLSAVERMNNNGPWSVPEGMRKSNAQFILSSGSQREGWTTSLSAYSVRWHSTDQIPQRLINAGAYQGQPFSRFDSLDPSDGANTNRFSLSGDWRTSTDHDLTRVEWYAIQYDLNLFSDFTYSLNRANDQFAQTDSRTVLGGKAFKTWLTDLGSNRVLQNTLGVQLRQDHIHVGLYDATGGQILSQSPVRDDSVKQTMVGIYGESEVGWTRWLKTIAGVRADQLDANVTSHTLSENSGTTSAFKLSPKFSVIFGPWEQTEFFFNTGRGFHSNDARGTTARIDPKSGSPIAPVPGLVNSKGREMGAKSQLIPNFQTTLAFWQLDFDSELVYVGDSGNTQPGRSSHRTGVEWSNRWTPNSKFLMDANLAWTTPRYSDASPVGNRIPNAVEKVATISLVLKNMGLWSGFLGVRYIGSAALIEDNSVRSDPSLTVNARVSRKMSDQVDVTLDVLNLTGRKNSDISYYYASRLAGEPVTGVSDTHVHPAEPRTLRLTARVRF